MIDNMPLMTRPAFLGLLQPPPVSAPARTSHSDAQAVTLVPGDGQDRARRIGVEHARIGGRPALRVDDAVFRHRRAFVQGHADFAFGDGAGRHVENDRRFTGDRNPGGDRIGRQPAIVPPNGATRMPAPEVLTKCSDSLPARAASNGQSPMRPRWPEFRSAMTETPCRLHLSIPSCIACSPIVCPKPNWPSTTAMASFSKTISMVRRRAPCRLSAIAHKSAREYAVRIVADEVRFD